MKITKMQFLLLVLIMTSLTGYNQDIKTYSGVYEGKNTSGEATYSYYENQEYERIYQGNFLYKGWAFREKMNVNIKGTFRKNLKHGLWVTDVTKLSRDKKYNTIAISISGEFIDGNFFGNWQFQKKYRKNGTIEGSEQQVIDYSNVNFENNKFIGDFEFYDDREIPLYVKGAFSKNGYLVGEWIIKWGDIQEIRKYENGYCYWVLRRNESTGDIIYKNDNSAQLDRIKNIQNEYLELDEKAYIFRSIKPDDFFYKIYDEKTYDKEFEGLRRLYSAVGFWYCKDINQCTFFMNADPGNFNNGNMFNEIGKGSNELENLFEREFYELSNEEILQFTSGKNINTKITQNLKDKNEYLDNLSLIKTKESTINTFYYSSGYSFAFYSGAFIKGYEHYSSLLKIQYPITNEFTKSNLNITKEYLRFLNRIIELKGQQTKKIEKELKGESDINKIIEILEL